MSTELTIFTIGHSNHTFEKFSNLVNTYRITAIADVRSVPYSGLHPQFNREIFNLSLKQQGIDYVFLGKELGGRSDEPAFFENGRVKYRLLAQTKIFKQGLDRLREGSKNHLIALMCSEGEPLVCHRTLLVSRELINFGIDIVHIHADGSKELHSETMRRLRKRLRLPEIDMFRSESELIEEAYSLQEARVAFVDERFVREPR